MSSVENVEHADPKEIRTNFRRLPYRKHRPMSTQTPHRIPHTQVIIMASGEHRISTLDGVSKGTRGDGVGKKTMEEGDRIVVRQGVILDCQCGVCSHAHAHTLYNGEPGRAGVMGPAGEEGLPHREINVPEMRKHVQTLTNMNCKCKVYCTCEEVSPCMDCRMMKSHIHVTSTGPSGEIGPVGFPGQYTDEMIREYLKTYKPEKENNNPILVIENCKWCRRYGDRVSHHHAVYQGVRGPRGRQGPGKGEDYYL